MPVTILEAKRQRKGSLCGFVKIQLGASLLLHDCPVLESAGRRWVGLPGKPRLDRDGRQSFGANGKAEWLQVISWNSRAASDRFSESVIAAIEASFPEFFAAGTGGEHQ
jgi:hypothetical protein